MADFIPAGAPVSHAIAAAPDLQSLARRVLGAIDSVHGDGDLPVIPARLTASLASAYSEANYYYDTLLSEAVAIDVRYDAEMPELSLLHEIGHFIDHKGLGFDFFLSSPKFVSVEEMGVIMRQSVFASEENPALGIWREAILASDAIQHLREVKGYRSATVSAADGMRVQVDIDHGYIDYLLEPRELFARSYAQFISAASQDGHLLRQLDALRQEPLADLYPLYWEDGDFLLIAEALDEVFRRRGWIQ